jgi:hypothetical protein
MSICVCIYDYMFMYVYIYIYICVYMGICKYSYAFCVYLYLCLCLCSCNHGGSKGSGCLFSSLCLVSMMCIRYFIALWCRVFYIFFGFERAIFELFLFSFFEKSLSRRRYVIKKTNYQQC